MIPQILSASLASLLLVASTLAAPIKRGESGPHITTDFPDPSIFHDTDGTWYAFATQSAYDNTNIHVQIASSSDWSTWTLHQSQDALPNLPSWVNSSDPKIWAPDINQLVSLVPLSILLNA